MALVPTSFLGILALITVPFLAPSRALFVLFLSMPLGATAAFNLTFGSIALADTCVLALLLSLVLRRWGLNSIAMGLVSAPGVWLSSVLGFGTVSMLMMPIIFDGSTEVYDVVRAGEDGGVELISLKPDGNGFPQVLRLTMGLLTFCSVAACCRFRGAALWATVGLIGATWLHASLAVLDLASVWAGQDVLAWLRTTHAIGQERQLFMGIKRLVGAFPEPSSFSYFTLGLFGFWLRFWYGARRRLWPILMAVMMAGLLLRSTSSAALVVLLVFAFGFMVLQLKNLRKHRRAAHLPVGFAVALPVVIGGGAALASTTGFVGAFADFLLLEKFESRSGIERGVWAMQALQNFWDTYGLGAGLGNLRSSGWLFASLGSLGLIGTSLFFLFLFGVFGCRARHNMVEHRDALVAASCQAGCAAVFLQALLTRPYPDLGVPFFAMAGMAVGLLKGVETHSVEGKE